MEKKIHSEFFASIVPAIDKAFSDVFVNCRIGDIPTDMLVKKASALQSQVDNYIALKLQMYCQLTNESRLNDGRPDGQNQIKR